MIVLSIQYLHSLDYIHRDIKPQNFLIFKLREKMILKVSDFDTVKNTGVKTDANTVKDIRTVKYSGP